jgi:hypothetical protein
MRVRRWKNGVRFPPAAINSGPLWPAFTFVQADYANNECTSPVDFRDLFTPAGCTIGNYVF